jgi:hypothetical protein
LGGRSRALDRRRVRRDDAFAGHGGEGFDDQHVPQQDQPDHLRGDEGHPLGGAVDAEGDADGFDDDREHSLGEQPVGGGVHDPPGNRQQRRADVGVVPDREEHVEEALGGLLDRARDGRPDQLARVDGHLEGGEEQLVLGAEVVVHQGRVDPGGGGDRTDRRTGETVVRERRPGGREDRGPGVGRPAPPTSRWPRGRTLSHATTGRRSARG